MAIMTKKYLAGMSFQVHIYKISCITLISSVCQVFLKMLKQFDARSLNKLIITPL